MKNRVITISREFGSGGRTIAKLVAEKLGIPYYDSEILRELANRSGFSPDYIEDESENAYSRSFLIGALYGRDFNGHSNMDDLFVLQSRIISELAEKGPCVIVGRCADYVLRDKADCLNVFIHAPVSVRADRIVNLYGERTDIPETRVKNKDKGRRAYYKFYTGEVWGEASRYDVCLDSNTVGIEKCADIIASLY